MPSLGSTRKTIRIGDDMLALVQEQIERRNKTKPAERPWVFTDYVMQAIADKLSHDRRGRKEATKIVQEKCDENMPREVFEEDY